MIKFNPTSLRSRIAQRMFGIFLLCTVIPFAGLTAVSFYQVSEFFHDKTKRQLRAMTKALGADTFERMLLSKTSLGMIASRIGADGKLPEGDFLQSMPDHPQERWRGIAVMASEGGMRSHWGDVSAFPELLDQEQHRLRAGDVTVMTRQMDLSAIDIFIGMKQKLVNNKEVYVIGALKDSYLWYNLPLLTLPAYIQPCVVTSSSTPVNCTYPVSKEFGQDLAHRVQQNDVGDFYWEGGGKTYHVSYWRIPAGRDLQSLNWVMVLRATREGIFASIGDLKNTFLLSIISCIGLSILLAIYYIRKRLSPVELLQEGTRKVAARDFTYRVQVSSGDEFQELAASLNDMTKQLGLQFHRIEATAEIDRAVLSLLDTPQIAQTILSRMIAFLGYDVGVLSLFDPASQTVSHSFTWQIKDSVANQNISGTYYSSAAPDTLDGVDPLAQRVKEMCEILSINDLRLDPELQNSSFIRHNGFVACLGIPLMVDGNILGVLTSYAKQPRAFSTDEIDFAVAIKDQAAIAIYNSQLYERAKQQTIELEKANNLKDEFLGIISHELRTPLNVIMGYVRMIHERILGDINGEQASALETIARHSFELLNMIESIMDATKIEAGAISLDYHSLDLPGFLDNLKSEWPPPKDKEVVMEWSCSSDLSTIVTDEMKLKRILQALINNAVKFTEKGHVTITASVAADSHRLQFSIADTGIGIPEESLPLIFELFRQRDSSKTREYEGLGLGLFIAQQFATLLGGTIEVESRSGAGSTFKLTIPARPDKVAIAA